MTWLEIIREAIAGLAVGAALVVVMFVVLALSKGKNE